MPEGDTIYRTARTLQKAMGGKVVTAFETGLAKLAAVDDESPIVGRTVERVEARGKWCLIFFSGDLILVTHMLMSGSWHIYRVGERWKLPRRMMRIVVRVGGASVFPTHARKDAHEWATQDVGSATRDVVEYEAVLFNAQVAEFYTARTLERNSQVPKLGLDVLSEGFSVERGVQALRERAASHPDDEVGVVLLNQRVMAGLGNVYKSEVAFAAGVNPFRAMRTITEREMEALVEAARKYMTANVAEGTSEQMVTYTGPRRTTRAMDHGARMWVYRRQGEECRRCGAAILMRKQGVQVRSTYWCPVCQPLEAG